MIVKIIPCLQDNYSYIIIDESNNDACVIDPSEAKPIIDFIESSKINLKYILNTHHHYDHVGGNLELKKKYNSNVVGFKGDKDRIPEIDILIKDNQIWKVEIPQPASIINEIHFANHLLQFEIMSQTNQFESYSLWHNDDIIFEWSPMLSAETIYTDTSITLFDKDSINIQWIRWRTQSDQDDWQDFEWIPINTIQETHLAKSPDGGQWEETQEFTLGKSNSTEALFESESLIPEIFVLYQNYPNPFNSKTRISFDLLENATVSLFIFDANGRIIDQFVESEYLQSGAYNFSWDATGHPTGIYFFTIQTMVNGFEPVTFSRKMIYLK